MTAIFGYIMCFKSSKESLEYNSEVINALPEQGAYLVRKIFSILPQSRGHSYYGDYIHFCADYKEYWSLSDDWIIEYEAFLSKLYWCRSEVINTWCGERFIWESSGTQNTTEVHGMKVVSRYKTSSYHYLTEEPF